VIAFFSDVKTVKLNKKYRKTKKLKFGRICFRKKLEYFIVSNGIFFNFLKFGLAFWSRWNVVGSIETGVFLHKVLPEEAKDIDEVRVSARVQLCKDFRKNFSY